MLFWGSLVHTLDFNFIGSLTNPVTGFVKELFFENWILRIIEPKYHRENKY